MRRLERVVENIKSTKIQDSKEIAIRALKFLKGFCKKHGFGLKFEVAAMVLERARPTPVLLHNCLEIIKKRKRMSTIDGLLKKLEKYTEKLAKFGSELIEDGNVIMIHSHSGDVLAVIKKVWKDGKRVSIIAVETDPFGQVIKTAKELSRMKVPVTLIPENAVGYFMKEVDFVVVGSDAIRVKKPLGVVSKIGTKLLALAAKKEKKKFIVIGNTLKIDRREKLVIEEKPPNEVYLELIHKVGRKKVKIRNPTFDLIEFDLVSYIVTEEGIFTPKEFLKRYGE